MYRVEQVGNGEQPVVYTFFDSANTDHSTPITGKAGFAYGGDDDDDDILDAWIYFGTGQYKEQIDKTSSEQQYFFGLKDLEGNSSHTMSGLTQLTTDMLNASAVDSDGNTVDGTENVYRTISGTNPTGNSWVLSLYNPSTASERSLTQPLVVGGVVFFTTFIPGDDVCEGSGDAYLFALDTETGLPAEGIFDINNDGIFDDNDKIVKDSAGNNHTFSGFHVGKGVPNDPVIHNDILFVGTVSGSDGEGGTPKVFKVNLDKLRSRIKAWHQKFN
jgi:Tfp pilus tip-associated adhesin PilY1